MGNANNPSKRVREKLQKEIDRDLSFDLYLAVPCTFHCLYIVFLSARHGRSLTWRQCLLASQPICWSCGGSGSAEASRSAFRVSAANAECRALNHTLASALSAALNQHSCTPSGEWSSRIRPSESRRKIGVVLKRSLRLHWEFFSFLILFNNENHCIRFLSKSILNEVQVQQNFVENLFFFSRSTFRLNLRYFLISGEGGSFYLFISLFLIFWYRGWNFSRCKKAIAKEISRSNFRWKPTCFPNTLEKNTITR